MAEISLMADWMLTLPLQQQSVLFLACRGPDGIGKHHPCKHVHRAYRATVLKAARYGRFLNFGERADTFMGLDRFADDSIWAADVSVYFDNVDELPHHYQMHLMHGAQILGYKHPDLRFACRWADFYHRCVYDMHLNIETVEQMDQRLNDWGGESWS